MILLFSSRTRSALLPNAPAFARRNGLRCWIANHVAERRGRSDRHQAHTADGQVPWTTSLLRQADQVAAQIDEALHAELDPLDREIALRRAPSSASSAETSEPGNPEGIDPGDHLAADAAAREAAKAVAARAQAESARQAATQKVAELIERRGHLNAAARDLADSWSSRCDELIARHRRGYTSRRGATQPSSEAITLPRHRPAYAWGPARQQ